MDDLLADDPDQAPPSAGERQDDPNERWQAMRWRALKRTDLRCERCGAEHDKRVLRYLYSPPTEWQPFVIGAPRRPDLYVVTVRVVVVPTGLPWTGEETDLEVLCMGCFIHRVTVSGALKWVGVPWQGGSRCSSMPERPCVTDDARSLVRVRNPMAKRLNTPQDLAKLQRARIVMRAQILRGEIEQIFTDCASWNDNARQADESPIDPDPDGQLRRMADGLDRMLEGEANR